MKPGPGVKAESIPFDVEARLLQELGERLVASPQVALLELVKNASDADAKTCTLEKSAHQGRDCLIVRDTGTGMNEAQFRERWMRIATGNKKDPLTPVYRRPVTGQKGIGRFAVRFLGGALKLTSITQDKDTGERTRLEAAFDWRRLDTAGNLKNTRVPYRISPASEEDELGTTLKIWRLRFDLDESVGKSLRTDVLQIVSPMSAFDAGPFNQENAQKKNQDPGFRVLFKAFPNIEEDAADVSRDVLEHAWARLTISLEGRTLSYKVRFRDTDGEEKFESKPLRKVLAHATINRVHADIAFAPKRKNAFEGVELRRPQIWPWLYKNSGVGIVDNGFRIRPYGFADDDWLNLNEDGVHNRRFWRSTISEKYFPMSEVEQARPKLSPALNLPNTRQLLGLVFVSSRGTGATATTGLIPAMDREGYLENEAFEELYDIIRGGLEFLASQDKARQLLSEEAKADRERDSLRSDLADAVDAIKADPVLSKQEKTALMRHYSGLAVRLEKQDEYDRDARQRLEIASGLGIVAGFMTHEAERLFLTLDGVVGALRKKVKVVPGLDALVETIERSRTHLDSYIRYTRLYTDSLRHSDHKAFSAAGQIEWIRQNFGHIPESRSIETDVEVQPNTMVPPMPVALYSAVLLNLYTNATKAIIARTSDELPARILISAWNDSKLHHLTVQDTGAGIPPQSRERIWDPFFTTTSRVNSPLGTGMGLGLSLVRDLVGRLGGKSFVDEASPGFITSIHVTVPRKIDGN